MSSSGPPDMDELREVTAGSGRFGLLERGRGPALVLLHGIGSGAPSWRGQLERLDDAFRVVAWDAPGYGRSSPLEPDAPDASDYAEALGRLLDALGVERAHLVGHSLGAVIAARYTVRSPERVASLTLASPAGGHARLPEPERARLREGRLQAMARLGPAGMARDRGPHLLGPSATEAQRAAVIETMSRLVPEGFGQAVRMLSGADTRGDVARLPEALPVQFIHGDRDTVTPPEGVRAIARERPRAPVHVLAGAGHACYLEQPDAFSRLLRTLALEPS